MFLDIKIYYIDTSRKHLSFYNNNVDDDDDGVE